MDHSLVQVSVFIKIPQPGKFLFDYFIAKSFREKIFMDCHTHKNYLQRKYIAFRLTITLVFLVKLSIKWKMPKGITISLLSQSSTGTCIRIMLNNSRLCWSVPMEKFRQRRTCNSLFKYFNIDSVVSFCISNFRWFNYLCEKNFCAINFREFDCPRNFLTTNIFQTGKVPCKEHYHDMSIVVHVVGLLCVCFCHSLVEQLSADIKVVQNAYRSHQQRKSQVVCC